MSSVSESANAVQAGLSDFDFQPRTRVIFGAGTFAKLGTVAREISDGPVLLVTDPGLREAGHAESAVRFLQDAGLTVAVFDDVSPNPTTDDVDRCVRFAQQHSIRLIVGLGGGSSMDCAKGANFLLTNGGRMHDYRGVGKAKSAMLPMVAVPTTSGTGSEAQSFAVIADAKTHMKMPCGDPKAACRIAILDPALTVTMPRSVAAATGVDAITHAIESFVTKKRNGVSQMFAAQAWQLLSSAFEIVMNEPDNLVARGDMQLGAHLAGAAIENSMLGAAHAAANPLSARFNTVHGIAVGVLLPHVIRHNATAVGDLYRQLAVTAGWADRQDSVESAVAALADGCTGLLQAADMPTSLDDAIPELRDADCIHALSEEAAQQWTGTFNPRTMSSQSFASLYHAARATS